MTIASEKIKLLESILDGAVHNKRIFKILEEMRAISETLSSAEKSVEFHNMLRGFNRMWGDEFSPKSDIVSPLLDDLFSLHGFPNEKVSAK